VVLAFAAFGCPPGPPPIDPPKKNGAGEQHAPPESVEHLKPRLEAALTQVRSRELLTTHGFWTVFHAILGNGLKDTMIKNPQTKERINAIDYICKGGELRGLSFVPTRTGLDVEIRPDWMFVGQGHQDQFIAEMAQWGMPRTKKFKVAGNDYTFEDFIRHSKMRASTKKDQELSWAVVIVAQYYGTGHAWTNSDGDELRCEDLVRYENNASINEAACGGTHRLFGLTWAYYLHRKNGGKVDGVWADVDRKIADYKKLAHDYQNPDGTFSTEYFKGKARQPDTELRISTTGHILEWLALAMTDEELRAPWVQSAVNSLVLLILDMGNLQVDGGALYHAAHGLHIYHERVFGTPAPYLPLRTTVDR
jgi:hypothetical protein